MTKTALLLLAALPLLAHAETWSPASNRDGDSWSIDSASIQAVTVKGKSLKQVMTRAKFKEVQEDYGKKFDESRSIELYDCSAQTSAIREENLLLGGAIVKTRKTIDDDLDFVDIFPDTAGADLTKAVCGK